MKLFVRSGIVLVAGFILLSLYWHSPFRVQHAIQQDLSNLLESKDQVAMAQVADDATAKFLHGLPIHEEFESITDAQGANKLSTGYEYYHVGVLQDRHVDIYVQEDRDTWFRKIFPFDYVTKFQVR
ncbi:hypothetical protein C7459_116100 [Tumebacillus permanentifrigoris]|uniref:Uncharacterized protein n=1 Tax=Tumebacillus permanentifrigoris TaxID=378543 RepID=A0A316D9B2_9BACL|nr:hypothetical protein C7459_116100 [Tumebacillus permanentifrigoris]